jgi:DNA-binding NarL/FixJ family response regulator
MKIFLVDDHVIIRDVIRKICAERSEFTLVGETSFGSKSVEVILAKRPDLVVLDLCLPDISGFEVLKRVRSEGFRPRVLVVSGHLSPYLVFRLEGADVRGFFDKCFLGVDDLRQALDAMLCDRSYFSPTFREIQVKRHRDPVAFDKLLTTRELTILTLAAHKCHDAQIAELLDISPRTSETHRLTIMRKIGVRSTRDLIRYADANGFTSVPVLTDFLHEAYTRDASLF